MSAHSELSKIRNIGITRAYRCRQDHDHGAHPVLYRGVASHRRRCTRAIPPPTTWTRSVSAASPSLRRGDLRVEGPPHQHHRHPRPHRLQHRGQSQPARARRRGVHHRGRRRRAAAIRDQLAPRRPLQRAARDLHQQARPHGRRFLPALRHAEGEARHRRPAAATPDRHRGDLHRCGRPGRDEGDRLGRRRAGRQIPRRADPGRPRRARRRGPPAAARHRACRRQRGDGGIFREGRRRGRHPQARHQEGHHLRRVPPGAVRHRLQEQGRAAAARRRARLPAGA